MSITVEIGVYKKDFVRNPNPYLFHFCACKLSGELKTNSVLLFFPPGCAKCYKRPLLLFTLRVQL